MIPSREHLGLNQGPLELQSNALPLSYGPSFWFLREQLVAVSEERRHKAAEVDQLGAELGRERSRGRRLGGEVQEAAVTLRHILTVKAGSGPGLGQRL